MKCKSFEMTVEEGFYKSSCVIGQEEMNKIKSDVKSLQFLEKITP